VSRSIWNCSRSRAFGKCGPIDIEIPAFRHARPAAAELAAALERIYCKHDADISVEVRPEDRL
jgi:hypothetical protein